MKYFIRLATGVKIATVLQALEKSAPWARDDFRQHPNSPHREAESIILRFQERKGDLSEATATRIFADTETIAYPAWWDFPEIRQLVGMLVFLTGAARVGRVMLTRLPSGGRIYPHADEGAYAEYYKRFHFCLKGGVGNLFRVEDEIVDMLPGELWWVDNLSRHSVRNATEAERIHLIVDLRIELPSHCHSEEA